MRIGRIDDRITFGIYLSSKQTSYGERISGKYKDYFIDIYTAKEEGKVKHKLFYVKDSLLNWLKSKLDIFQNGKKLKTIKSKSEERGNL